MYKRSVQVTALARRERKVKEGKGKGNRKKKLYTLLTKGMIKLRTVELSIFLFYMV